MKKIYLIALIFIINIVYSQKQYNMKYIDSLINNEKYYEAITDLKIISINKYDDTTMANIYDQLGMCYYYLMKYGEAKDYTIKSYHLYLNINDNINTNRKLITLGLIYTSLEDYKLAKFYLDKSLKYSNKNNLYFIYSGYIDYFISKLEYDSASKYINKCIKLYPNDEYTYLSMGKLYNKTHLPKLAKFTYLNTIKVTNNINIKNECYINLAKLEYNKNIIKSYLDSIKKPSIEYNIEKYEILLKNKIGNNEDNYINLLLLKDSLKEQNLNEQSLKLSAEFDSMYKVQEATYEIADKNKQNKNLTFIIYISAISFLILVILLIYIIKKKNIIKKYSKIIQEKNLSIMDSIYYAKGIQETIFNKLPNNTFSLFQPKDIISGDFCWYKKINNKEYYAVIDCTGHGVPGAMLTMLCAQLFDNGLEKYPDNVGKLIIYVQHKLSEYMEKMDRNDTFEGAIISIENNKITYYGIKRPLYILNSNNQLTTYKPEEDVLELTINDNSTIYITTDGFIDQFNNNNKKYGSKQFRDKLININSKDNKIHALTNEFYTWKGEQEQTDDVLVLGIEINKF